MTETRHQTMNTRRCPSSGWETTTSTRRARLRPDGLHLDPGPTVRFERAAGTHSATAHEGRVPSDVRAFDSGGVFLELFSETFLVVGAVLDDVCSRLQESASRAS
jgi:plastocyanin